MKNIIISPSKDFYGSERVMIDFLTHCSKKYLVFVPNNSLLFKELLNCKLKHSIKTYNDKQLSLFYLKLTVLLLFKNGRTIYSNEGGHIRYLKLLAKIFKRQKFIVHLRIIEDVTAERLKGLPLTNLKILVISDYLKQKIPNNVIAEKIYDPFIFDLRRKNFMLLKNNNIIIGIIGRVSLSKGFEKAVEFCKYLEKEQYKCEFHFYGGIDNDLQIINLKKELESLISVKAVFHGYVDCAVFYPTLDLVIHFSLVESLGRIYFESLQYGIPVFGFNSGGIGEIATQIATQLWTINYKKNGEWEKEMYETIKQYQLTPVIEKERIMTNAVEKAKELFNMSKYVQLIEEVIN